MPGASNSAGLDLWGRF